MRAAPGAIERVRIDGEEVRIQTIGHEPSVGICGSGILDVVAELLKSEDVQTLKALELLGATPK